MLYRVRDDGTDEKVLIKEPVLEYVVEGSWIYFVKADDTFQMLDKRLEKTSSTTKLENIPASMVSAIRGKSISLASNAVRIDRVEFYFKFYGAIAVSIIIVKPFRIQL